MGRIGAAVWKLATRKFSLEATGQLDMLNVIPSPACRS